MSNAAAQAGGGAAERYSDVSRRLNSTTATQPPQAPRAATAVVTVDDTAGVAVEAELSPACEQRLRLSHKVAALYQRGPRPVLELLLELIAAHGPEFGRDLERRVNKFNSVPADIYATTGARQNPRAPLHGVKQ